MKLICFTQLNDYLLFMLINGLIRQSSNGANGVYSVTIKCILFAQMY
ncbi:MAG: hypothetical protein GX799_10390 [Crenarchaeota archaeon]|nr:hypothetical protein [Thermoproteota archaeon]